MVVSLLDNYRMAGLFKPNLPLLSKYFFQLNLLIKMQLPKVHEHLSQQGVEPTMYASQWFLTVFTAKFPLFLVMRVLDLFLLEGFQAVFQVALRRRLRVALPLVHGTCGQHSGHGCHHPIDTLGDHLAACSRTGLLAR